MAKRDRVGIPRNITCTVSTLNDDAARIEELFFDVLSDYCARFGVEIQQQPIQIDFNFVHLEENYGGTSGVVIWKLDGELSRLLVQIRDPWLNDWEPNSYVITQHLQTICHEMVHVCQQLTGRKGFKMAGATWDKGSSLEEYYFDPEEIEARALSDMYREMYAEKDESDGKDTASVRHRNKWAVPEGDKGVDYYNSRHIHGGSKKLLRL